MKILWFKRGNVLSTAATLARWAELDHCGTLQAEPVVDSVRDDGTALAKQTLQCAAMSEVDLFEIRAAVIPGRSASPTWASGSSDGSVASWTRTQRSGNLFARHRG